MEDEGSGSAPGRNGDMAPQLDYWGAAEPFAGRLKRLALRLCQGDEEGARDLVQQTLANSSDCEPLQPNGQAWALFRKVMVNARIDRARLAKREFPLYETDRTADGAHLFESRLLGENIRRTLAHLDERDARIIRMVYGDGRSLTEVASSLGMTVEAVKQRLKRARAKFRHLYSVLTEGEP
jgi:RNA polymerase sigma-70 factor (ECF subfamily)